MTTSKPTTSITGLHHVAFRVQDFDQTIKFFTEGLGFQVNRSWSMNKGGRAAILSCGSGNNIEVFSNGQESDDYDNQAIYHFALRTDDIDADHKRALDCGARERSAPKNVTIPSDQGPTEVRISFVQAPGRIVVEFFANGSI